MKTSKTNIFNKMNEEPLHKTVLGQVAVVRSSKVTESFGEAILEDGGAGLHLKIRSCLVQIM